jgi:hypothetical protein
MDEIEQKQSGEIVLPVEWYYPKGTRSRYANNILVRTGLYEIIIAFFEVQWPDLLDGEELRELEATHIECVSKVIVRPELVPNLIEILGTRPESSLPLEEVPSLASWQSSEGTQSSYANNMVVQSGQYEVIVSFFEGQLPLIFGTPEETKKQIEKLESVRAECVSKISIPSQLLPVLINTLKTSLEDYLRLKEHYHRGS